MLRTLVPLLILVAAPVSAQTTRAVDVTAADGVVLKATYYDASRPGPGVLLLHMCNTTRQSWEPLGRQLAASGIHALALDYRGFGESGGDRFDRLAPRVRQQLVNEAWPGDVDAALAYLLSRPGVSAAHVGAAGGSCGVTQAVQLARRHKTVTSLVLLAGPVSDTGRVFLQQSPWLPVFAAAAADDQFDSDAPRSMQWVAELSGNPRSRSESYPDGRHGTEIFGPHPELVRHIVEWYADTLIAAPASPGSAVSLKRTPASEFWQAIDQPDGVERAVRIYRDARASDPRAFLFPEAALNQTAYAMLQAGRTSDAISLFKLNVETYPASANAQDSLGDGYFADGQMDLALAASERCLKLLETEKLDEQVKQGIRQSAEQKIDKIKARR